VVPVENRMKDRSKFTPMMLGCYTFIAVIFLSLGVIGYLGYGVLTPNEISLALSQDHTTVLSQLVNAALAFSVIFTYPLQLYPALSILEEPLLTRLPKPVRSYKGLNRWVFRWLVVMFTAATAVLIPNFSALIALIGALGSATLSLTLPALFHLKGCILDQVCVCVFCIVSECVCVCVCVM
jgi:amino acid permease